MDCSGTVRVGDALEMTVLYDQMTVVYDQMTVLLTALEHSRKFDFE